jgi:hypothetical protein
MLAVFSNSAPYDPNLHGELPGAAGGAAIVPPLPLEETFLLHSRPGAPFIIFLDFDGHITQNTPWNGDPNDPATYIPTIVTPPYSIDASSVFSDTELLNIQEVWARVSEDFAPFDVDVTTEDPDPGMMVSPYISANGMRVIIGGSDSDWYSPPNDPAGGVATGAFAGGQDWGVFSFAGGAGPKFTAEVTSHEVGHTLGLAHWGQTVPDMEPTEYYGGSGTGPTSWAPIMGVGYSRELVTWSKGEYNRAINVPVPGPPITLQDDIATITNTIPFITDDHGDDITTATPLTYTATDFFGEGSLRGVRASATTTSTFSRSSSAMRTWSSRSARPHTDLTWTFWPRCTMSLAR